MKLLQVFSIPRPQLLTCAFNFFPLLRHCFSVIGVELGMESSAQICSQVFFQYYAVKYWSFFLLKKELMKLFIENVSREHYTRDCKD